MLVKKPGFTAVAVLRLVDQGKLALDDSVYSLLDSPRPLDRQKLDPLSLIISADIADALCIAHLYDESIRQSNKSLELDPNFSLAHFELGQALEQQQRHDAAIVEFQKAMELSGHRAVFDSNLAYVYAVSGRRQAAIDIARDLEARRDRNPSPRPPGNAR